MKTATLWQQSLQFQQTKESLPKSAELLYSEIKRTMRRGGLNVDVSPSSLFKLPLKCRKIWNIQHAQISNCHALCAACWDLCFGCRLCKTQLSSSVCLSFKWGSRGTWWSSNTWKHAGQETAWVKAAGGYQQPSASWKSHSIHDKQLEQSPAKDAVSRFPYLNEM